MVRALYDNVIVPHVPNFGRACSGDPAVSSTGMVLVPSPDSPLASFDTQLYGPPTAVR